MHSDCRDAQLQVAKLCDTATVLLSFAVHLLILGNKCRRVVLVKIAAKMYIRPPITVDG